MRKKPLQNLQIVSMDRESEIQRKYYLLLTKIILKSMSTEKIAAKVLYLAKSSYKPELERVIHWVYPAIEQNYSISTLNRLLKWRFGGNIFESKPAIS